MNIRLGNLFWGVLLILAGGIFLAQNLGYLGEWSAQVWMWFLAALSAAFFVTYIATGFKQWGWLFPACTLGGTTLTLALAEAGLRSSFLAVPILVGAGLPFLVVFALAPRQHWWALIPAGFFASAGLLPLLLTNDRFDLTRTGIPSGVMLLGWALTFGGLWLRRAKAPTEWAKVPAIIFALMSVGSFITGSNLEQWWPIIPIVAGVLLLFFSLRPRPAH